MDELWYYIKWFLFLVAPIIMLVFATDLVGVFIWVIRKILGIEKKDNDDDDDVDVYRY